MEGTPLFAMTNSILYRLTLVHYVSVLPCLYIDPNYICVCKYEVFAIKTTYFQGNRWFFYVKKLGVSSDTFEFDPVLTLIAFLKSSGNAKEPGLIQT